MPDRVLQVWFKQIIESQHLLRIPLKHTLSTSDSMYLKSLYNTMVSNDKKKVQESEEKVKIYFTV